MQKLAPNIYAFYHLLRKHWTLASTVQNGAAKFIITSNVTKQLMHRNCGDQQIIMNWGAESGCLENGAANGFDNRHSNQLNILHMDCENQGGCRFSRTIRTLDQTLLLRAFSKMDYGLKRNNINYKDGLVK
jgi:hypothetical protein